MNISYSRYTAFVQNPERFRLHYMHGLTPDNDDSFTRMNLGRRRGSCFHEMYEANAGGHLWDAKALAAKHGPDALARATDMLDVVPDLGELFLVEAEFVVPIGDGKHSINGRIDHGFEADGHKRLGDFKTTKGTRTKKELNEYFGTLETSTQSHFYLKAAASMGFETDLFTYHVILDRKDAKSSPKYIPFDLPRTGPSEVARTMAEVYAACEVIQYLTNTYGIERPWPHSNAWPCCGDKFFCGYQGLCGRTLVRGCVPPGFTSKYAEVEDGE